MKKKILTAILATAMSMVMAACGAGAGETATHPAETQQTTETADQTASTEETQAAETTTENGEPKILKTAASFAYPSLDVHAVTRKGLAEGMEGIYDSKEIASTFTYMKR